MPIEITPIRSEHIAGFHLALGAVARERRFLTFLDAPPLDETERFVTANIRKGHPQFVALAQDGEVVGWCDILPASRPVHAHVGVLGMGLIGPFRGMGIGRQLIETTLAAARQSGLWRTELTVYADNAPAIRLYEQTGFEVEGIKKHAAKIDDRLTDVLMMARLEPPSGLLPE
jgi:ribosomal protein S18 acetylase RimI-like enzyme